MSKTEVIEYVEAGSESTFEIWRTIRFIFGWLCVLAIILAPPAGVLIAASFEGERETSQMVACVESGGSWVGETEDCTHG